MTFLNLLYDAILGGRTTGGGAGRRGGRKPKPGRRTKPTGGRKATRGRKGAAKARAKLTPKQMQENRAILGQRLRILRSTRSPAKAKALRKQWMKEDLERAGR